MTINGSTTWLQNLTDKGFRITPALRAVVDIISSDGKALSAQQVFDYARRKHPKLGLMTVYRALEKLEEMELIQRVHDPNGCHTYAVAPDGHQHLLLCLSCGKVEYFSGDELEALFQGIGTEKKYQIKGHWLQLFGFCQECKQIR